MLSDTTISTKQFPSFNQLREMRAFDENPRDEKWTKHERHFFIVTDSARPVYVRYGDEINVTPLLCTIVTFSGQLTRDGDQKLQHFVAGDKLFVFYSPSPFIFVCVSSVKLPVKLIMQELKHLESIITSLLSYGFKRLLAARPNYDIKNETQSAERLFTSMLENMDTSHTFVFHDCVPMCGITKARNQFKKIIRENHSPEVYSIIVFFRGEVLCQINSRHFEVSCDDIMILANNAYPTTDSLDNSWKPIWLPSREDMLHFLTVELKEFELTMILITNQINACPECTRVAEATNKGFLAANLKEQIQGIPQFKRPGVLHWIACNRKIGQVHAPYIPDSPLSRAIYRAYAWAEEYLSANPMNGIFYFASEQLTIVGKQADKEISMIAMNVGTLASQAQEVYSSFEKYFKENQNVFFDMEQTYFDDK